MHAEFYYFSDSVKAGFCRDGNSEIRQLAKKYAVPTREVGKVVVPRNSDENQRLDTLFEREIMNGVKSVLLEKSKLSECEPLAKTHQRFLWSPLTAISDSKAMYGKFLVLVGIISFGKELKLRPALIKFLMIQVTSTLFITSVQ